MPTSSQTPPTPVRIPIRPNCIFWPYVRIIWPKNSPSKPKSAQFVRIPHPGSPRTFQGPRAARLRRATANPPTQAASGGGPKSKSFNLNTYKLHALGDYPQTIRERGTTDNYTSGRVGRASLRCTAPATDPGLCWQVENEHRRPKNVYRTNTNKHLPERDIGRVDRRHEVLRYLVKGREGTAPQTGSLPRQRQNDWGSEQYWMSEGSSNHLNLRTFVTVPRGASPDPARKVSRSTLQIPTWYALF